MVDPKRKSQKAKAFSRGNATSGAPICSGSSALANPANSGVANISSMIVPCIVNSWLYWSLVGMICIPGSNSSARMMSAITPPSRKNVKDEIRYMYPMVLWSVEVIHLTMMLPFCSVRLRLSRAAWRGGRVVGLLEPDSWSGSVVAMVSPVPRERNRPCRAGSEVGRTRR